MAFYCYMYAAAVEVVDGSEKWGFQRLAEPSASVSLWVPEALAPAVAQELMAPLPHPLFPFMYVKTVNMAQQLGKGISAGHTMNHARVQLEVTYSPWEANYVESVTIQAQMITLPKWRFRWSNGRMLADGEEPSRIVRTQKIRHSYTYLRAIPEWAYSDVGKVNSEPITTSQGLLCEPETLLYEGAETNRTITRYGTYGWQMTTNFSYNPNGWNKWFNTISGTWLTFQRWNPDAPADQEPDNGQNQGQDPNSSTSKNGRWEDFKMYELADLSGKF